MFTSASADIRLLRLMSKLEANQRTAFAARNPRKTSSFSDFAFPVAG
jgi:hypothetical protein